MIKSQALPKGNKAILALALFFGLLSALLVYVYLSRAGSDNGGGQPTGATQMVVVAAQDIAAGTKITPEMIKLQAIPASLVLPNGFDNADAVVGQVTAVSLTTGEQILASRISGSSVDIAQFGDEPPLSLLVPAGMRGFSIHTSEVGAAGGLIRPGDYVDVIMSGEPPVRDESSESSIAIPNISLGVACYVVQDVQVLAISQAVTQSSAGVQPPLAGSEANPEATSATLAVTPQQAWLLAAAQRTVNENTVNTQLWLSLRPFGERGEAAGLPQCTVIQ